MSNMTADEPAPTSRLGQPRTEHRLGRTRLVPTERRRTRWYRDWPPELELKIAPTHRHPAILIGPIFLVLFGLAAAGELSTISARGNGPRIDFVWLAWSVLVLRLIWKVFDWRAGYFFVASDRIILVSGILRRKITAIWLAQVTAIELKRTAGGLILGYGELIFHSPCPDAALVTLDYAAYPYELFLDLRELAFPELGNDLFVGVTRPWFVSLAARYLGKNTVQPMRSPEVPTANTASDTNPRNRT